MIKMFGAFQSGAAVGGDGVATANQTSSIRLSGILRGIHVAYKGSPPAGTTDVTIATAGLTAPAFTLLTLTDAATDAWKFPKFQHHGADGANIASNVDFVPIDDFIKVTIAQANADDYAEVYILLDV